MLVHVPGFMLEPGLAARPLRWARPRIATSRRRILGAFGQVARDPASERFGRSWLRLRAAPAAPLHRFVVTRSSRAVALSGFVMPMAAIVEDHYKLVVTFEDGLVELYNLAADPGEEHDLGAHLERPELRRELELYRDLDGFPWERPRIALRHAPLGSGHMAA